MRSAATSVIAGAVHLRTPSDVHTLSAADSGDEGAVCLRTPPRCTATARRTPAAKVRCGRAAPRRHIRAMPWAPDARALDGGCSHEG
eukprot:8561480-Alexandrium_andersonii.AAC.1